jgi:hypothetical protein
MADENPGIPIADFCPVEYMEGCLIDKIVKLNPNGREAGDLDFETRQFEYPCQKPLLNQPVKTLLLEPGGWSLHVEETPHGGMIRPWLVITLRPEEYESFRLAGNRLYFVKSGGKQVRVDFLFTQFRSRRGRWKNESDFSFEGDAAHLAGLSIDKEIVSLAYGTGKRRFAFGCKSAEPWKLLVNSGGEKNGPVTFVCEEINRIHLSSPLVEEIKIKDSFYFFALAGGGYFLAETGTRPAKAEPSGGVDHIVVRV